MLASLAMLVTLQAANVISGVCVDGLKHPAVLVQIEIRDHVGRVVWTGTTDQAGRFAADVPAPSFPCRMRYRAPYGTVRSRTVNLATAGLQLSVPQVRVRVIAHDELGHALPDAKVRGIYFRPGPRITVQGNRSSQAATVRQAPVPERFAVGGIDSLYVDKSLVGSIRAVASSGQLATREPAKADADGILSLDLAKGAWSKVSLNFVDQKGEPIKVPAPSLYADVTGYADPSRSESDGSDQYTYSPLFAGQKLVVTVEKQGFAVGEDSFGHKASLRLGPIEAGKDAARTLQLYPLDSKVGGTVVDASGKPLKGVAVFAEDPMEYQGWDVISSPTDDKGHFQLNQVAHRKMKLLLFPDFQHVFGIKGKMVTVDGGKLDNRVVF